MSNFDPEQLRADIGRWKREIQTWRTRAGLTDDHPNISKRLARIRAAEELLQRAAAPKPYGPDNPQCAAEDATGLDCAGPAGHPDGSDHANLNGTWSTTTPRSFGDGVVCPIHHTQLRWGQCAECGPDGDSA